MKTTFLICLITIAVQLALAQKYTNKFDNVDVDGVLSNNRILTNYIKCLMEKGPCTPEGRELKSKYNLMVFYIFLLSYQFFFQNYYQMRCKQIAPNVQKHKGRIHKRS